eukprot:8194958-Pyramimonas_sp.AAC.1
MVERFRGELNSSVGNCLMKGCCPCPRNQDSAAASHGCTEGCRKVLQEMGDQIHALTEQTKEVRIS